MAGEVLQGGLQGGLQVALLPRDPQCVFSACSHRLLCCKVVHGAEAMHHLQSSVSLPTTIAAELRALFCTRGVCVSTRCGFWAQCCSLPGWRGGWLGGFVSRDLQVLSPALCILFLLRPSLRFTPLPFVSISHFLCCCWVKLEDCCKWRWEGLQDPKRALLAAFPGCRMGSVPLCRRSIGWGAERSRPTVRSSRSKTSLRVRARRWRCWRGARSSPSSALPCRAAPRSSAGQQPAARRRPCSCSLASHVLPLTGAKCSLPQRCARLCLTAVRGRLAAVPRSRRPSSPRGAACGPDRRQWGRWDCGGGGAAWPSVSARGSHRRPPRWLLLLRLWSPPPPPALVLFVSFVRAAGAMRGV